MEKRDREWQKTYWNGATSDMVEQAENELLVCLNNDLACGSGSFGIRHLCGWCWLMDEMVFEGCCCVVLSGRCERWEIESWKFLLNVEWKGEKLGMEGGGLLMDSRSSLAPVFDARKYFEAEEVDHMMHCNYCQLWYCTCICRYSHYATAFVVHFLTSKHWDATGFSMGWHRFSRGNVCA